MSLRSVIARHGSLYQYIRAGAGSYTQGRYVAATPAEPVNFAAVVQPVTGRLLQALPEGQSAEDTRVVYTVTELKTRTPTSEPDTILYKGDKWRIIRADLHEGLSGAPHWVCMMARQTDGSAPV